MNVEPTGPNMERHLADHFDQISLWYPPLKNETFETEFIDVTLEQAMAIKSVALCPLFHFLMAPLFADLASKDTSDGSKGWVRQLTFVNGLRMTEEEKNNLKVVEKLLDNVIVSKFEAVGAFVSPKDAVLNGLKVKDLIGEEIKNHPFEDVYSEDCYIADTQIYWRCISKVQCVHSGADAMDLLLRSNRILEDISRGELMQGGKFETKLVVRKWADIDPELEFRTFVSKGNVTGITQYHMKCYVPEFVENKDKIARKIVEKVKELNPLVEAPDNTYTIDFVFSRDFEKVTLIEINDPPPTAGTSLFIWDNMDDRKIMFEGPLTVRVLEKPYSWEQQTDLHPPLKDWIDRLRGRVKNETENEDKDSQNCLLQ